MKTIDEIVAGLGISRLNAMQEAAIDAILHTGQDLTILSPTGSGKTLAYLLPLAQRIDTTTDTLQAVVVVPGRELAMQSATVLRGMGAGVRAAACYGGRPTMDEHRELRRLMPHIIFATPGRMNDHIDKGNVEVESVRWIVIDEYDKCLEMGFHDEMQALIRRLPARARQLLLSATPAEEMRSEALLRDRSRVLDFLPREEQVPQRVCVRSVSSPEKDKLQTLRTLLITLGEESSIVFLNYRESVERTAEYLRREGFSISTFHGGMEQRMREDQLYKFSNGSALTLVSTDLASRGLDIPDIRHIIHYHLPESEDGYIHRVGRTARWDRTGQSYFILAPGEQVPGYVDADVEEFAPDSAATAIPAPRMATIYIGKGKRDKISKGDIVGLLCKKTGITGTEIGRIDIREYYAYVAVPRQKLHQTLRLLRGEKIKGVRTIFEEVR